MKTSKDAVPIPKQQLEGIEQRLNTIAPRAARRKIKLKYLEHRVSLNIRVYNDNSKIKKLSIDVKKNFQTAFMQLTQSDICQLILYI